MRQIIRVSACIVIFLFSFSCSSKKAEEKLLKQGEITPEIKSLSEDHISSNNSIVCAYTPSNPGDTLMILTETGLHLIIKGSNQYSVKLSSVFDISSSLSQDSLTNSSITIYPKSDEDETELSVFRGASDLIEQFFKIFKTQWRESLSDKPEEDNEEVSEGDTGEMYGIPEDDKTILSNPDASPKR